MFSDSLIFSNLISIKWYLIIVYFPFPWFISDAEHHLPPLLWLVKLHGLHGLFIDIFTSLLFSRWFSMTFFYTLDSLLIICVAYVFSSFMFSLSLCWLYLLLKRNFILIFFVSYLLQCHRISAILFEKFSHYWSFSFISSTFFCVNDIK